MAKSESPSKSQELSPEGVVPEDWSRVFEYRDGYLFNRVSRSGPSSKGELAGCASGSDGRYRQVGFNLRYYREHNVIWEMFHGPVPEGFIVDHQNGDGLDNRIENLRLLTQADNTRNAKLSSINTSGYKGVSYRKENGWWRARVNLKGKTKTVGQFKSPEEAARAYDKAVRESYGEIGTYNFPEVGERCVRTRKTREL